jgi:hypothetical protein
MYRINFVKNVIVKNWRKMFNRAKPTEEQAITALRAALENDKDTKITVTAKDGNTWTLYNDTLRGCFLKLGRPKVIENEKQDIIIKFIVYAQNGRVGNEL